MSKKPTNNQNDSQITGRGAWKKLLSTIAIITFGILYMTMGREFVDSHQPQQQAEKSFSIEKIESGVGVTVLLLDSGDVYTVPVEFGIRAEVGSDVQLAEKDGAVELCIAEHCTVGTKM
jgi:hypothetical protein